MKKIKLAIAAAAVVLAVGGAAITKANAMDDQQYYFVSANGQDDGLRTAASEVSLRGCNSNNADCAKGYSDPDHTQLAITLKKQ